MVCKTMTDVEIPDTVTYIGSYAFRGCINLTSVDISSNVTSIGVYAFYECLSLASFNVDVRNSIYKSVDGALFDTFTRNGSKYVELLYYPAGKKDKTYSVPSDTDYIRFDAFYGNEYITAVDIPEKLNSYSIWASNDL